MIDFLVLGIVVAASGKVLLGVAVMLVHWRVVKEHKIDNMVISEMRRERNVALVGITLILIGTLLELWFYGYVPSPEIFSPYLNSTVNL